VKRNLSILLGMLLVAATFGAAPVAGKDAPKVLLVKNATIWTMGPQGRLDKTDLLVENGKVSKIGANLATPQGALVVDATGKHVTPGLIDAHSHSAIRGGVNEGSNNITAEVRIHDVIDPASRGNYYLIAGGLTAGNLLHGSANSIGGQNAVVKFKWESTAEEMVISSAPPGIKFALGENPKRSNSQGVQTTRRYPATRMGVYESIRERFTSAREYLKEWEEYNKLSAAEKNRRVPPRRDLQLEALGEILQGKRLVHSHSYRADEILALIRLADEFGFRIATLQHVLEGYKVADEMAAHGVGGSTFSDWWGYKLEAYDAIPFNGALMNKRGVTVSFNSDSGEVARRMNFEAAKAVRYGGLDEIEALKFVTVNPARQLRVDDRIGSLEPGKDADFVIWSGHPLSVYTHAEQTWIDGAKEFDRAQDLANRAKLDEERQDLIRRVRAEGQQGGGGGPRGAGPPSVSSAAGGPGGGQGGPQGRGQRPGGGPGQGGGPAAAAPQRSASSEGPLRPIPAAQPAEYRDRVASPAGAHAIVGATIHTLTKGDIPNGTVVFQNGKITAVGANVAIPRGARIHDGKGKHVYPGMINTGTTVGLTEIGSVAASNDTTELGQFNPQDNVEIAVNPEATAIGVTRYTGVTHVLALPQGGLISGTSALLRLEGWTYEELTAAAPVAMHVRWPVFTSGRGGRFGFGPPEGIAGLPDPAANRERDIRAIRRFFEDARAYQQAKNAAGKPGAGAFKTDPVWEAMLPVLEGKTPVIVHASESRQIKNAIEWAEHEGVRIIIMGEGDIWRVADTLKEKKIPVILTGTLRTPERQYEPYDAGYAEAAKLHKAGVQFAIATGANDAQFARNLPFHAGMAAAFGLPKEEALKAVTLYPAEILGVGAHLGAIEVGKSASLIVTNGDPLEIRTIVHAEFIDGRPVDLNDNRHSKLYQKWSSRPKPAVTPARSPKGVPSSSGAQ
jgi:imidazolonepropionase-like amidohydrolase